MLGGPVDLSDLVGLGGLGDLGDMCDLGGLGGLDGLGGLVYLRDVMSFCGIGGQDDLDCPGGLGFWGFCCPIPIPPCRLMFPLKPAKVPHDIIILLVGGEEWNILYFQRVGGNGLCCGFALAYIS